MSFSFLILYMRMCTVVSGGMGGCVHVHLHAVCMDVEAREHILPGYRNMGYRNSSILLRQTVYTFATGSVIGLKLTN